MIQQSSMWEAEAQVTVALYSSQKIVVPSPALQCVEMSLGKTLKPCNSLICVKTRYSIKSAFPSIVHECLCEWVNENVKYIIKHFVEPRLS